MGYMVSVLSKKYYAERGVVVPVCPSIGGLRFSGKKIQGSFTPFRMKHKSED
jgi:hypothetical protein